MIDLFYHPYLEHEDVINIVMSAFADKAIANFIDSVKNNRIYRRYIVRGDIFTTYENFINNIDTDKILSDFNRSFDADEIIELVLEDEDGQLEAQDIEIEVDDESLPLMARDTRANIINAIARKQMF